MLFRRSIPDSPDCAGSRRVTRLLLVGHYDIGAFDSSLYPSPSTPLPQRPFSVGPQPFLRDFLFFSDMSLFPSFCPSVPPLICFSMRGALSCGRLFLFFIQHPFSLLSSCLPRVCVKNPGSFVPLSTSDLEGLMCGTGGIGSGRPAGGEISSP